MTIKKGNPNQSRTRRNPVAVLQRRAIFRRLVQVVDITGLNDAEFARTRGLPHSLPGKWRAGAKTGAGPLPSSEVFLVLAEYLSDRVSTTWLLTGQGPRSLGEVLASATLDEFLAEYIAGEVTHQLGAQNIQHAGISIRPRAALAFLVETAVAEARSLLDHLPLVLLRREWARLAVHQRRDELARVAKVAPELADILTRIGAQGLNGAQPLNRLPRELPSTHVVGWLCPASEDAAPEAPAPAANPRRKRAR